jgi:hypothetical protein
MARGAQSLAQTLSTRIPAIQLNSQPQGKALEKESLTGKDLHPAGNLQLHQRLEQVHQVVAPADVGHPQRLDEKARRGAG